MNTSSPASETWSLGKWCLAIGILIAAQFILLKMFPVAVSGKVPEKGPPIALTFTPSVPATGDSITMASLLDPTLFALPDPKGFSGESWLKAPQFENSFSRWEPVARWLNSSTFETSVKDDGESLESSVFEISLAEKISPPEEPPTYDTEIKESFITVNSASPRRILKWHPDLPVFETPRQIEPTTVQLLVNEMGQTISAVVVIPSDFPEANTSAIRSASRIRFRPTPEEYDGTRKKRVDTLEITFHWQTIPPRNPSALREDP